MNKKIIALITVGVFVIGLGIGYGGSYYQYVHYPQKQAEARAKEQQEKLNKMVCRGDVVEVKPTQISINVQEGEETGTVLPLKINEYTSIQVGQSFVNKYGDPVDLTKWFKQGDYIDAIVKDGQAFALHRDFRPEEQSAEVSILPDENLTSPNINQPTTGQTVDNDQNQPQGN